MTLVHCQPECETGQPRRYAVPETGKALWASVVAFVAVWAVGLSHLTCDRLTQLGPVRARGGEAA